MSIDSPRFTPCANRSARVRPVPTGPRGVAALALSAGLTLASVPAIAADPPTPPVVSLPRQALAPDQLAVVVNDLDPLSRRIGAYYIERRGIPAANLIRVRFAPDRPRLEVSEFQAIYRQVRATLPADIQAYALTWAAPYSVDCMSITTAFAAGYDPAFCASSCALTRVSPLYASDTQRPYTDFGWRPAMSLAGTSFAAVKALIDRGIAADDTRPAGTGYLVRTGDRARSVRAQWFARVQAALGRAVRVDLVEADTLTDRQDVLFYFTGAVTVPQIETNQFRPGAVADHLTSTGGQLTGSRQMSSLRWLEAGATGSYGTVAEPCNFPSKFPDPGALIATYVTGSTLIEAYWKSVQMPGQGIFIGEPLARPFGGYALTAADGAWVLTTPALRPGPYRLEDADDPIGRYRTVKTFGRSGFEPLTLRLPTDGKPYYRIVPDTPSPIPSGFPAGKPAPSTPGASLSR